MVAQCVLTDSSVTPLQILLFLQIYIINMNMIRITTQICILILDFL